MLDIPDEARDYVVYGLRVRSSVPLNLASARMREPAATPDVTVRFGAVPAALRAPVTARRRTAGGMDWDAASGALLLHMRGVARYLVTDGCDVSVEPRCGDDRWIGKVFVETVWTAVLLQRGIVPFHAGAVELEGGAALFLGRSGSGKSSLVGALLKRGHAMLADDVVGVAPDSLLRGASVSRFPAPSADFRLLALPAYPGVRLRADALDALGWRGEASRGRRPDKYLEPAPRFRAAPLPLRAVYLLTSHDRSGIEIETLRGVPAVEALWPRVRQKSLAAALGRWRHFRVVTAVAQQAPVVRVTRPAHPFRLDALADQIEADARRRRLEAGER